MSFFDVLISDSWRVCFYKAETWNDETSNGQNVTICVVANATSFLLADIEELNDFSKAF